MEMGKKIKELRTEKKITQKELADGIFVSRSTVAKWENCLGIPSPVNMDSLCSFFGVERDYFDEPITQEEAVLKNRKLSRYKIISAVAGCLCLIMLLTALVCPLFGIHLFTFNINGEYVDRVECIDGYYVAVYNEAVCMGEIDGSPALFMGNTSRATEIEWIHEEIFEIIPYKRFLCFSKKADCESYTLISEDKTTQCGYLFVLRSGDNIYCYYRRDSHAYEMPRPDWYTNENFSFSCDGVVLEQCNRNEFVSELDFTDGEHTLSICGTNCVCYSTETFYKDFSYENSAKVRG